MVYSIGRTIVGVHGHFRIDADSGLIYVAYQNIDREQHSTYLLSVRCVHHLKGKDRANWSAGFLLIMPCAET